MGGRDLRASLVALLPGRVGIGAGLLQRRLELVDHRGLGAGLGGVAGGMGLAGRGELLALMGGLGLGGGADPRRFAAGGRQECLGLLAQRRRTVERLAFGSGDPGPGIGQGVVGHRRPSRSPRGATRT